LENLLDALMLSDLYGDLFHRVCSMPIARWKWKEQERRNENRLLQKGWKARRTEHDTEQGKDDQLTDDQEEIVPRNDGAIKPRVCQRALISAIKVVIISTKGGEALENPTYRLNRLMMIGSTQAKRTWTVGGSTPETMAKVAGEALDQDARNGTANVSCTSEKCQFKCLDPHSRGKTTYRIQAGQDGYHSEWDGIEEAHEREE
jgi:hypothetical protein